jgi:hypothetical protein
MKHGRCFHRRLGTLNGARNGVLFSLGRDNGVAYAEHLRYNGLSGDESPRTE